MKDTAKQEGVKGESYDFGKDFKILTRKEKRALLRNAKTLLKLQKENALSADTPPAPSIEGEN
ncbi:hypothetical protein FACS1894147_12500 [Spirochaetia bacterium]|nr:hypothetical protein FACS1894147_12500 [Spirochaetia bacterium]